MNKLFLQKRRILQNFVEYKSMCIYKSNGKISNQVTLDEINKLIELQLLKPKGKGRAIHYNKNGMCP
ncbi:hypothetical protein E3V08_04365 [Candidatus Atribacteria bacterium MT.SAG.1]|nr:hypothetical protein E3V08_04365 [Candidatus Atribacteria bacterium MT.SAG.1]